MKPHLREFSENTWSQFGEDGCIEQIFKVIGTHSRVAVEFGAGGGLECSNTAHLWHDQGWTGVLVEADPNLWLRLKQNAADQHCVQEKITPVGPSSIDTILQHHHISAVDLMSIDVDGDDYFILRYLAMRPRVIIIEFNPTVPPHVELHQSAPGETFGASLLAIIRLAEFKNYRFVGATQCNAFLVRREDAAAFAGYETDPLELFPLTEFTFAATDFAGRPVLCGKTLPWGVRQPYVPPLHGDPAMSVADSPEHIRRGFESFWGPASWITMDDLAAETAVLAGNKLRILLHSIPGLVCIDLSGEDVEGRSWLWDIAAACNRRAVISGPVLGLIRNQP